MSTFDPGRRRRLTSDKGRRVTRQRCSSLAEKDNQKIGHSKAVHDASLVFPTENTAKRRNELRGAYDLVGDFGRAAK